LDIDAANAIKTLLEKGPTTLRNDLEDWKTELFNGKNILFYQGKNYIPRNQQLRTELIQKFHDSTTAGHPGELETLNAIKQHYWWPGMRSFKPVKPILFTYRRTKNDSTLCKQLNGYD